MFVTFGMYTEERGDAGSKVGAGTGWQQFFNPSTSGLAHGSLFLLITQLRAVNEGVARSRSRHFAFSNYAAELVAPLRLYAFSPCYYWGGGIRFSWKDLQLCVRPNGGVYNRCGNSGSATYTTISLRMSCRANERPALSGTIFSLISFYNMNETVKKLNKS